MNEFEFLKDATYPDSGIGKWGVLQPKAVKLDEQIRATADRFAQLAPDQRDEIRKQIPRDNHWTLMSFASRSAVFALRKEDPTIFRSGLRSMTMSDARWQDFRDVYMRLGPLQYTCIRLRLDPKVEFADAAKLAEPKMAEHLAVFAKDKDLNAIQKSWCFREVETADGIGFVNYDNKRYEPDLDLVPICMGISDVLDQDKFYEKPAFSIATSLPAYWLRSTGRKDLENAVARIAGCATIRAKMNPARHANAKSQSMIVFLMELEAEELAQAMFEVARSKKSASFSMLGVREKKLFALVVARSFVKGVDAVENDQALLRFEKSIHKQLLIKSRR